MKLLALLTALFVASASAGALSGAIIVAADGTFLGTCSGEYGRNSISNEYSQYGGQYGRYSMYNQYGTYGGQYSRYSPFNPYGQPPYLLGSSSQLSDLFESSSYQPSDLIIAALQNSGALRVSVSSSYSQAADPNVLRVLCKNP